MRGLRRIPATDVSWDRPVGEIGEPRECGAILSPTTKLGCHSVVGNDNSCTHVAPPATAAQTKKSSTLSVLLYVGAIPSVVLLAKA